jgi:hypothetical protein
VTGVVRAEDYVEGPSSSRVGKTAGYSDDQVVSNEG